MRAAIAFLLLVALCGSAFAQEPVTQSQPEKRSWLGRVLHPFHSSALPEYRDARLRGLTLDLQVSPQPLKLSEVRQLEVKLTLTNRGKRPVTLEFPTDQRIEIYLKNAAGEILTKWSDNHAFDENPGTILINPQEHIDYNETIATRDLTSNKVFVAEVFFPKFLELHIQQKFLTAP